ncbi:MAG: glutathione S-transferase family protein [Halobacteriales archaeon]
MNVLVDGEWTDGYQATNEDGEFERGETTFRDRIGPDAAYPAEPGRYHLYISRACPWAHGAVLVRTLLGLEDAVSMDVLDPYREDRGWQFTPGKAGCTADSVNGFDYLAEAYTAADPAYTGRVTVPVLWDTQEGTVVNNESVEIMRMLAANAGALGGRDVDLYPEGRREEIDDVIETIYEPINNGVYRAGFADSQAAYEAAIDDLFSALDRLEATLEEQRYLVGDRLTLADLRLFPTLVRFDPVYHVHFKCSVRRLVDYPNLWGYTRDVYGLDGVADTVNMDHITEHYYTTHTDVNPKRIIAAFPDVDFEAPHDRDRLPGGPPAALG